MLGEAGFELMFDGAVKGEGLFDSLVDRVRSFGEGHPQDDDISMLEILGMPLNTAASTSDIAVKTIPHTSH